MGRRRPRHGRRQRRTTEEMGELVRADFSQTIELKDAEVDSFNDHANKLVFYTDGRKIQKSKDDSLQQISAHWNGSQLVTDEKGPQRKEDEPNAGAVPGRQAILRNLAHRKRPVRLGHRHPLCVRRGHRRPAIKEFLTRKTFAGFHCMRKRASV